MIIGDSRCPIGSIAGVANVVECDFGAKGLVPLYQLDPPVIVEGQEMYFQEKHLMPLGEAVEIAVTANMLVWIFTGEK
jgi:hypothetical protein